MKIYVLTFLLLLSITTYSQENNYIKDEKDVPEYELPELLKSLRGKKIKSVKKWEKIRRPELLKLFGQEIYGKVPENFRIKEVVVNENNGMAFKGLATRKQIELIFENNEKILHAAILIYLPRDKKSVPLFVGYNFYGNHTIADDVNIRLTESWVRDNPSIGIVHNQVTEQSRGARNNRWPVEKILKAGYGLATIYYGDIDPDWDSFDNGIHPLLYEKGQIRPRANEWGAISAWAWGLSRAMDYFEQDPDIHAEQVIVMGHSRLGKTALWAAALDRRFAMCISNNSGCMGAALSKRKFGETISRIAYTFPHWFCNNFKKYVGLESELPVDQHMLLALIAPRPLYIASAEEDWWADPRGEFLSAVHASPVYKLYGLDGLPTKEIPALGEQVIGTIGYHIRKGKHDITDYDWEQFIKFANYHLK